VVAKGESRHEHLVIVAMLRPALPGGIMAFWRPVRQELAWIIIACWRGRSNLYHRRLQRLREAYATPPAYAELLSLHTIEFLEDRPLSVSGLEAHMLKFKTTYWVGPDTPVDWQHIIRTQVLIRADPDLVYEWISIIGATVYEKYQSTVEEVIQSLKIGDE
jgi:hypothetical protein